MEYIIEEIKKRVNRSLNLILTKDQKLFTLNSSEQSISNKLSSYLSSEFPEWDVDCEYNRDMNKVKKLKKGGKNVRIYPDIIIHHRESDENLLVIEIKKSPPYSLHNQDYLEDLSRIQKMTSDRNYHYLYGLLILFFVEELIGEKPLLRYFQMGKEI